MRTISKKSIKKKKYYGINGSLLKKLLHLKQKKCLYSNCTVEQEEKLQKHHKHYFGRETFYHKGRKVVDPKYESEFIELLCEKHHRKCHEMMREVVIILKKSLKNQIERRILEEIIGNENKELLDFTLEHQVIILTVTEEAVRLTDTGEKRVKAIIKYGERSA